MSDLRVLRVVELKGRVKPEDVGSPLGVSAEKAGALLAQLAERGALSRAGAAYRLSEAGRAHLAVLLEEDRTPVDQAALALAYEEFCAFNGDLKAIVTAWQMKDSVTPNDHADAGYDSAVLARLLDLHERVLPLAARLGTMAPRLEPYAGRLAHAAERIAAGEVTWVARPIMDSYHTVWFELHEDLIQLAGRTRLEEAVAGRAH